MSVQYHSISLRKVAILFIVQHVWCRLIFCKAARHSWQFKLTLLCRSKLYSCLKDQPDSMFLQRTRLAVLRTTNQCILTLQAYELFLLTVLNKGSFVSKIWQPSSKPWVNLMDRGNNFFSWSQMISSDFRVSHIKARKVVPKQFQAATLKTAAKKAFHWCFFPFCQRTLSDALPRQ